MAYWIAGGIWMCDFCGLQKPCRCDPERLIKNLEAENKRLREALEKVQKLGYNEDCMFCGFKDKAVKQALEGRRE